MRRIELRTYDAYESRMIRSARLSGVRMPDGSDLPPPQPIKASEVLLDVLDSKRDGFLKGELRQCLKLADLIENANGALLLEEADWNYLKSVSISISGLRSIRRSLISWKPWRRPRT